MAPLDKIADILVGHVVQQLHRLLAVCVFINSRLRESCAVSYDQIRFHSLPLHGLFAASNRVEEGAFRFRSVAGELTFVGFQRQQ